MKVTVVDCGLKSYLGRRMCCWFGAALLLVGCGLSDLQRIQIVKADVAELHRAISSFHADVGRLPSENEQLSVLLDGADLKGWNGPYLQVRPVDPWLEPYRYKLYTNDVYIVQSSGPDQRHETDDDIIIHGRIHHKDGQLDKAPRPVKTHKSKWLLIGIMLATSLPVIVPFVIIACGTIWGVRCWMRNCSSNRYFVRRYVSVALIGGIALVLAVVSSVLLSVICQKVFTSIGGY